MIDSLVGLYVTDNALYQAYRDGMTPLLKAVGGGFRYDFKIGETLQNETEKEINRLFVIYFPDRETKERFFSSPAYLAVREKFFNPAVGAVSRIGEFERQ